MCNSICSRSWRALCDGGVGGVDALDAAEVMRCVQRCMLEVVEDGLCLMEVLDVPEVMRCA